MIHLKMLNAVFSIRTFNCVLCINTATMITIGMISQVLLFFYVITNCSAGTGIGRYGGRILPMFEQSPASLMREPQFPSSSKDNQEAQSCTYNICQEDDEYPTEEIWEKLQKFKDINSYFGSMHKIKHEKGNESEPRISGSQEQVCLSHAKLFSPKSMRNLQGDKKYLINIENTKYTMTLVSEICHELARCKGQYKTNNVKCVQKYGTIKLLSYNKGDEELLYDSFYYPTTCVCKLLL